MNNHMLKVCAVLMAGTFVLSYIGTTAAYADPGERVRHGRFVWHKAPSGLDPTRGQTATVVENKSTTYDKGDLGTYVRHGRFVKRVVEKSSSPSTTAERRDYEPSRRRVADHIKHKHYLP